MCGSPPGSISHCASLPAAALTLLDLQQNAFTQPPPALAAATALVHLDLLCDGLRLNAEQVDGLRKHKPALRRLRCGMLPGVYRHLRATAPELTISSNSDTW